MFKTELRDFTVKVGAEKYSATAPTSLFSVLEKNGVIKNPYYKDEEEKRFAPLCEECEISVVFTLSADAARLKYAYLKIPDLDSAASVSFNGTASFELHGARNHNLNVSGYAVAGENTLSVKFPPSDKPRDITFFECAEFFAFSRAHISGISAKPIIASDGTSVDIAVDMLGDKEDIKAVATLVSPSGKIYYGGLINGRTVIKVPDPLLWWPSGYGVQNLYKLGVNLYYENEAVDSGDIKLGLRSLFRDGRDGAAFTVNGTEFFGMGAEYRMHGNTPSYRLFAGAERFVKSAVLANMNFIRFVGGGRYPTEAFLDLCDSYGIAVEYVLGGDRFVTADNDSIRRELAYNFKKMSRHPSLVCVSYDKSLVSEERAELINEAKSAAISTVFVRETDGTESFSSTVSIPDKKTLLSICELEDMNIFSYVMEHHEESPRDTSEMLAAAAEAYKYAHGMDELTYMSGILRAHSNEGFINAARVLRSRVGCAVVSALADHKPSISHGMIDYDGRFKTPYYYAKQSFAPLRLIPRRAEGYTVSFVLSNESRKAFSGTLEYSVKDAKNNSVFSGTVKVSAEKYSASSVFELDLGEYISGHEREYYLEYVLYGEALKILSGAYLFVAPKHFCFEEPMILSEISGSGREFTLTVRASALAKDVVVRFESTDAVFEENCIDITDSSVRRIAFTTASAVSAERLMSELRVMSVYNIGRG